MINESEGKQKEFLYFEIFSQERKQNREITAAAAKSCARSAKWETFFTFCF